ncbi:hypothetical protein [Erysipelothrix urinaevulpis]|uniref:hypothetical protein n=1 Tax=Erysipelothrix urinaevulpis TaxID=2683717 RepID=UPI001356EEAB|nr:hypothetical protein [Erysipelothrix urinaevulpis]
MRKILLVIASLALLTACQPKPVDFNKTMEESLARPLVSGTNHNKPFYKYYLPPNAGVKSGTQLASLIEVEKQQIMMNLKVSRVVASQHGDGEVNLVKPKNEKIVFSEDNRYLDQEDIERSVLMSVYEFKDNNYMVMIENDFIEMISLVNQANYDFMVEQMIMILRSVQVEERRVFEAYSNKEIVQDSTIQTDFFEHVVPEDGNLIDMYNQLHPDDKIEEQEVE